MKFYILDVFAKRPYQGNQLAVFFPDGALSKSTMQTMAREINFSESVFLTGFDPGSRRVEGRIFTPRQEVLFAGHPVIGSAYALQRHFSSGKTPRSSLLNLPAGTIPLDPADDSGDSWTVRQPSPTFGEILDSKELCRILSLPHEAILPDTPVCIVSTGLPHVIVPLRNREFLGRCRVNLDAYYEMVEKTKVQNILVYCPDPHEAGQDYAVRMFAHALGVAEDPATGSGNGCLAAYLLHHSHSGVPEVEFIVGQGYEMERPSQLHLKCVRKGDSMEVFLSGRVQEIASGEWPDSSV